MHSNLANHLHSEECNALIKEYEKCNNENTYLRYLGVCNSQQTKMTSCIQNELKKRRIMGGENQKQKELDYYMKRNPQLAEKVKLLEELRAKKEQEQKASK